MRLLRTALCAGVAAMLATSPPLAADEVRWSSVRGLFPGPKAQIWTLSAQDVAPWRAQAAREDSPLTIGYGDERPWTLQGQPTKVVALHMPLAVGCKYGPPGFIVGVLDANDRLIAKSAQLFSVGGEVDITRKAYRIDTARYRISDGETAFAVRIVHYRPEAHWCFSDQVLHLFRVVGSDVVRILEADAFYEQLDQIELARQDTEEAMNQLVDAPNCSFDYDKPFPPKGRAAVFRMLPSKTQGFYDIQRTQKGGPTVVFRWNGQRYVMEGKDPVDHHVREEWDWCTGRRYLERYRLPPPAAPAQHPAKD